VHFAPGRKARFVEVNESFVTMLGYARAEVIGRTELELGIWADAQARGASP